MSGEVGRGERTLAYCQRSAAADNSRAEDLSGRDGRPPGNTSMGPDAHSSSIQHSHERAGNRVVPFHGARILH
jgi:hypothetical protein